MGRIIVRITLLKRIRLYIFLYLGAKVGRYLWIGRIQRYKQSVCRRRRHTGSDLNPTLQLPVKFDMDSQFSRHLIYLIYHGVGTPAVKKAFIGD